MESDRDGETYSNGERMSESSDERVMERQVQRDGEMGRLMDRDRLRKM